MANLLFIYWIPLTSSHICAWDSTALVAHLIAQHLDEVLDSLVKLFSFAQSLIANNLMLVCSKYFCVCKTDTKVQLPKMLTPHFNTVVRLPFHRSSPYITTLIL